jgi:ABC-type sugar transport system ATPase subunit
VQPFVELKSISKNFDTVKALSDVSLSAFKGEVLALVGENGAGKSTLMNILSGVYPANSYKGHIFIDGNEQFFSQPTDAKKAGVSIIHQELSSFSDLSVAENMCVGNWPNINRVISWQAMHDFTIHWLNELGVKINPETRMNELSTGSQQLVEIAKALSKDSEIIIFDEPTSSLTTKESETLFKIIFELKKKNKAIIYISHRMEEVFLLSDKITVLRDGTTVHTSSAKSISEKELIKHMVGRELNRLFPEKPIKSETRAKAILEVNNLVIRQNVEKKTIGPISFAVHPGEILGIAGLLGSGRSEVTQAIFGKNNNSFKVSGEIRFKNKNLDHRTPRLSLKQGIGLVSEDRKAESIFATRSLDENTSVSKLILKSLFQLISPSHSKSESKNQLNLLNTRYASIDQDIRELSGGNQQKIVIARILQANSDLIILDEPTRGVDVGAKYEIYQILFSLAAQGKALIVISSDLPELMGLSDRILVLNQGRMTGEFNQNQFSQTLIMEKAVL